MHQDLPPLVRLSTARVAAHALGLERATPYARIRKYGRKKPGE
jgi:hypothetical protein